MSRTLIRLVGGENAGTEVWHDPDTLGPIIRMMIHPDFNACRDCTVTHDMPVAATLHQEEYLIHKINYESQHRHYYAAPVKWRLVDLMNHMWDGYKTDADQEKRNGH